MIPNIGPLELGIVLVVALLVLGPKRLPAAGRSLGRGLREFKQEIGSGPAGETAMAGSEAEPAPVKGGEETV